MGGVKILTRGNNNNDNESEIYNERVWLKKKRFESWGNKTNCLIDLRWVK